MTCEKAMDRYLRLDKDERVPFGVTVHLIACPACRTAVRRLTKAERAVAVPFAAQSAFARVPDTAADSAFSALVAKIASDGLAYPSSCPAERRVSLYRWLVCGLALILGFAVVPFSSIGVWTSTTFGSSFIVPFYLIFGLATAIYCGLFVGTNIDFFVKKFGLQHTAEA